MPSPRAPSPALSDAAVALRKLRMAKNPPLAVVRRRSDGRLLAVIDAGDQRVHTTRSLEHLVEDLATGNGLLGTPTAHATPAPSAGVQFTDESFVALCWMLGERLGRDVGLAPWLSMTSCYHLIEKPAAADIGNDAGAKRLVELLGKRETGVAALIDTSQLPHRSVYRLLNSMSLCGHLGAGPAPRARKVDAPSARRAAAQQATQPPKSRWLAWLSRLPQLLFARGQAR